MKKLFVNSGKRIPFNDLSRIHKSIENHLLEDFKETLDLNDFVLGKAVVDFESQLSQIEGAKHAITVNSGTSALILILRSLNIGENDEVLVPAMTFVATAFAVMSVGAQPRLIDIDPLSGLIDLEDFERKLSKKTKAAIFVSLHGRVDLLDEFNSLCKRSGVVSIIDAAQSQLGTFAGLPQVKFAEAVAISFYPGKNLGALGEGGAVLTDSSKIASKIKLFRNWGGNKRYEHKTWGGNFRLDTLQCRFLATKMQFLESWTHERKRIATIYQNSIDKKYLMSPILPKASHVYHIFALRSSKRNALSLHLENSGVSTSIHYPKAIHQNSFYESLKVPTKGLIGAEKFARETLSIPLFPGLTDCEIKRVIDAVMSFEKL